MLDALTEMGHENAYEMPPLRSSLGSPEDPFVLMSGSGRPIARYYIEADEERCWVRLSGSDEFVTKLAEIALRDGGNTVH